jgi:hypothetical protein
MGSPRPIISTLNEFRIGGPEEGAEGFATRRDFSSTLRVLYVTFDSQNYAIALPKAALWVRCSESHRWQ